MMSLTYWIDAQDPLFREMISLLRKAHTNGYSVVELSRALHHKKARKLYNVMRDEGIIPKLPRMRQMKFDLPPLLEKSLRGVNLGYHQWSNSHGFNPALGAHALKLGDYGDEDGMLALRAFQTDFPGKYKECFGEGKDLAPPSFSCLTSRIYG